MRIKKIGHCCLIIKINGKTILTDPGTFTTEQNDITGVDIILITHEHQDHLHIDSVKQIMTNNPNAVIVTNAAVGKLLDNEQISYRILEGGQNGSFAGVDLEGFGSKHAVIYKSLPVVENTGYMIAGQLCYPGDAFEMPKTRPEIIALPVAAPWLKISESFDYAEGLKPKFVFPVHDAIVNMKNGRFIYNLTQNILGASNIKFVDPGESGDMEF